MPKDKKMTIEESLAQLEEDFDDSEWQQNLFIEYAESQSKEYQDLVFGRNAELTEKKDTPSEDTPQQSVNFNFGDIVWGFSEYKITAPKNKTLYNNGERRLGFVINSNSSSVTCLQIVSANNKDNYNKNLFAIKIKDYDPNHPTQEGFVICNKVFVSPLEYEYPAVDQKTKKFMEINGNLVIIQEHVRGNDFFKLPQKYKDEVYNTIKEFNGSYNVPKLSEISYIKEELTESIKINDTLNKDLWDDNDKLKTDVREKLLDIADAFLDNLKEDKIDIQVKDIRLLGSNANYNYTDKSDLDLHIVAEIDPDKYEQQLYNCYKTLFNSKYDIKIKGREVEVYVEDVKAPAKSNGVYSILTDEWIKKPKKELLPSIDYEEFEKEFDEWEDIYFDLMDDLEELGYDSKSFPMEEKLICESAELWDLDWYRAYNKNYDIFSTNNSYGGKDAYTWATNDLDYLDFIEDDEKVAKLKLKPCKLLFYNMTKDELDRLQDKYGETIGKNWEYFDTVNPGDDEMNIINQEGYDGFYDSENVYVKKEFLEVIDDNIQLNEKMDESLKEELIKDDKGNQCYAFFTPNQLKTYLLNQKDAQRFFIDENLPIYLAAAAFTITHIGMVDLAREQKGYDVKFNEYEPKQICCLFVPKSDDYFDEEDDAINDGYDTLYEYEEGYKVYSRENDFEKFSLCKLLGNYKKKNRTYTELKDKDGNHLDGMFVFEGKNTLKEKVEKILDLDYDANEDDIPRGYVISTDDEMLKFLKDYKSWEQFKIVYDPVENWYLVGDPWDVIHQNLIDAAVDCGFYDTEKREIGKKTRWDSIYDTINNSTNQIYINFDDDDPEEYPFREVFEFNNAPMYVYSYHENDIDETPFLKKLKKLNEEYKNGKLIVYRVGQVDDFKQGLFFADTLNYYDYSDTNYKKEDAESYELNLDGAKIFDPVKEWDLDIDNWSAIRCDLEELKKYGYNEDEYYIEYLEGVDYDNPDEYHEVLIDTDGLADFGYKNNYDITILRDIPIMNSNKRFTEYCVHNKKLIKKIHTESLNESYDRYLYHATFGKYWKEIKKAGYIGNSKHKNWDFSNKNVVCLAKDPDEAYSYCDSAEDVPESVEDSGIIVLKIDTEKLDKSKLDFDRNQAYDSDYITDDMVSTYEYSGVIPLDAVVEVIEESFNKSLLESKQDKENFKKWLDDTSKIALANTNYSNSSIEANAEFLFNWFEQHRGELKSPENDYYYWIKQDYAPGAYLQLNRIASEHGQKASEEKKAKEGAKLLYSDKDWKVYEITNYEASAKYGKGTKWCISGSKRWANGENGKKYFNDYAEQGIQFYFFINADGHKYALSVYPDKNFEVFNDEDVSIAYIPDAPVLEEIPVDYYAPTEERIFKNLLFSNQLPNDLAEELIISAIEDQESYYISDLNDLVHTIDEWIPDGWMEYQAVENGDISKEEYERITGEEYDGGNWDGDYPQIDPYSVYSSFKLTDNNCLITKNNLINGVKQAYKKLYPKYMFTTEGYMEDTEIRLLYAYLDLVIFGVNVAGEEDLEKYCYYELCKKARNNETLMKKLNDLGLSKDFLLNSTIYSDND